MFKVSLFSFLFLFLVVVSLRLDSRAQSNYWYIESHLGAPLTD